MLGVIDAALGRKEEALREGRRALELLPVKKDPLNGILMMKYLAVIAAWVGEKDLACEQLATAVRYPNSGLDLSYGDLKLMPWWDPLRGDPRFEKIVASLAPKEFGSGWRRRLSRFNNPLKQPTRLPLQSLIRGSRVIRGVSKNSKNLPAKGSKKFYAGPSGTA